MNYIELLNLFYERIQCSRVSNNGQLLYYTLLAINNKSSWSDWFSRTNVSISSMMGVSEKAFINARAELKQLGLIDFIPSKKRGECTKYRILYPTNYSTKCSTNDSTKEVQTTVQSTDIDKLKQKQKSMSDDIPEKPEASVPYSTIQDLYNSVCGSYPRLEKLSEARRKAIRARMRAGYVLDDFRRLFEMAEASDFLKGRNNRNWSATFDWLIADANMAKVLDGNYENRKDSGKTGEKKTAEKAPNRFRNFEERGYDYDSMVWNHIREQYQGGTQDGGDKAGEHGTE